MRVLIYDDEEMVASSVAGYIIGQINGFSPTTTKPNFVLGLPTGSSPLPVYRRLVDAHRAGTVSFARVATVNMDEYVGLDEQHPQSYHTFMHSNLFQHVDIPAKNINILDGNAPDLQAECERYEAKIQELGGIDLFLSGVGRDGHIAFNEPGSSLASRTRVEVLAHDTVLANSRFFGGKVSGVPARALTVGVQTIFDAREVVVLATGAQKAVAVQKAIEGGVSQMCTLSSLQMHPRATIVLDEQCACELKYGLVKHFKASMDLKVW